MNSRPKFCCRLLLTFLVLSLASCSLKSGIPKGKLTIGIIAYGEQASSVDQFTQFDAYLAKQTNSIIELEPAFNERQAVAQIQRQNWSIVFASPGLAAIAIDQYLYIPIFRAGEGNLLRSVVVVRQDARFSALSGLTGQVIALGQRGSATGYYLPLYDLYGLTPAEVRFADTPQQMLEWIQTGQVAAGALGQDQLAELDGQFPAKTFRVLHTSRPIPTGAVLLAPTVDRNQQEVIVKAMNNLPPNIVEQVGYIPNTDVPDYRYLIELIRKVKGVEGNLTQKPAPLYVVP